jgi:hypothetical protein
MLNISLRKVTLALRRLGIALPPVALAVSASLLLLACILPETQAGDANSADGGATSAVSETEGRTRMNAGGVGTKANAASIDPTTQWMCMKNAAGGCTSCKQDADCPNHVCEHGYCMDCRDASQCGAADSCIENRCVPERKPSSVWATSGGGQTSAVGFKLQVSVGVPAPVASASAYGFKLSVAPGAGSF